jgi:hypothetical protein
MSLIQITPPRGATVPPGDALHSLGTSVLERHVEPMRHFSWYSTDRVQRKGCDIGSCAFIAKRRMRVVWVAMKQKPLVTERPNRVRWVLWATRARFSISNFRSKMFENTKEEPAESSSGCKALCLETRFNMLPSYFLLTFTTSFWLEHHTLPFNAWVTYKEWLSQRKALLDGIFKRVLLDKSVTYFEWNSLMLL